MSNQPVRTAPTTGLPAGVHTGPLGSRLVAQLIDVAVPVLIAVAIAVIGGSVDTGAAAAATSVVGLLLIVAWFLLVWWMFATRAAGPGMRLMKLQLVGLRDGRPIGYGRWLLRTLVLAALTVTVVGLVLMLVFLVQQLRRQGWHDLAADSVVIRERTLAPARTPAPSATRSRSGSGAAPGQAPAGSRPAPSLAPADQPAPASPSVAARPAAVGSPDEAELESPMGAADSVRMGPRTPSASTASVDVDDVDDGLPKDLGWFAVMDDGREIAVTGLVLLGRNPQARPGEEDAELIKVADDTRTVSKTHLALSVDGAGLTVMDRGSTNGTTLTDQNGASQPSPAGDLVPLREGSIVSFGDHWLKIEHRA